MVGTLVPPRLPVAPVGRHRVPSIRSPSRALKEILSPAMVRLGRNAAASTAGIEFVTWRAREPSGATPGTGSSHRSWGRSWLSPIAASQAPSARNPTERQTPGHGLTTAPEPAAPATTGGGFFGGRPRPRLTGLAPPIGATTRSIRASWWSPWTKRLASGAARAA